MKTISHNNIAATAKITWPISRVSLQGWTVYMKANVSPETQNSHPK